MKPIKKTIIIDSVGDKKRLKVIVDALPLTPKYQVEIRPYKAQRSVKQNKLYWKWITIIGNELGYTKEEMHRLCVERFLVTIFIRDKESYAAMVESVKNLRKHGLKHDADVIKTEIINLTSTTDCNTAQFAEYLTDIERDAAGLNIILPHPDDLYWEAMGIKRGKHVSETTEV